MILTDLYYFCKPLIPRKMRVGLRRARAAHKRRAYANTWPIDEGSATPPDNWPGWPNGKRFALVLTHDVEGQLGLDRVKRLANLESQHGFRSSFNFVPEGEYRVSRELRLELAQSGFEVGIHGLKHDGRLYRSHAEFSRRADKICAYRREWGVTGFRSPFMHHNLEWIHQLGMEYDASTFDTDPFEPQPDGVSTIFPFWVANSNGGGYVELPYTLVQDYTLFTILQEEDISLWQRKLDWVVSRGGMVLINTHPDYMCFDGQARFGEYPASHYAELLAYVLEQYAGAFWHALPRDVARFYRASLADYAGSPVTAKKSVQG